MFEPREDLEVVQQRIEPATRHAVGAVVCTPVVLGVVFGIAGLLAGPRMLEFLGAEDEVARLGWEYFQILAIFMPLFFVSSVLRAILTGEGDAKTPMIVLAVSTAANIVFDALFIFGFTHVSGLLLFLQQRELFLKAGLEKLFL